jgi:hypothetical protein
MRLPRTPMIVLIERLAVSGAGLERASFFVPEDKAMGMERNRRHLRRSRERQRLSGDDHHQIAACDDMIAGSAHRVVSWASRDRGWDVVVRQAPVTEPGTDNETQGFRGRLLHRGAERGHGDLGLAHQYVCRVPELAAQFDELLGGRACFLRPASHFRREHRAAVEMGANGIAQIVAALRAQIRVAGPAREQFVRPEPSGAQDALPDSVFPAVLVEKNTLFEAEPARPAAVEVDHAAPVAVDGVLGRERLPASGAGRLTSHLNLREDRRIAQWSRRFGATDGAREEARFEIGRAEEGGLLSKEGTGVILPAPTTRAPELTQAGVLSPWCRLICSWIGVP